MLIGVLGSPFAAPGNFELGAVGAVTVLPPPPPPPTVVTQAGGQWRILGPPRKTHRQGRGWVTVAVTAFGAGTLYDAGATSSVPLTSSIVGQIVSTGSASSLVTAYGLSRPAGGGRCLILANVDNRLGPVEASGRIVAYALATVAGTRAASSGLAGIRFRFWAAPGHAETVGRALTRTGVDRGTTAIQDAGRAHMVVRSGGYDIAAEDDLVIIGVPY